MRTMCALLAAACAAVGPELLSCGCALSHTPSQGRIFVTRDQKLALRRDVGGSVYLLGSEDPAEQLAELRKHFGIT